MGKVNINKQTLYKLNILGTRGIPAKHGGFETFAEYVALYLANKNWQVTVYCQELYNDISCNIWEDHWQGIRLIHIPVKQKGAFGTAIFDWKSIQHAITEKGLMLTLGYNTAIFSIFFRLKNRLNLMNMDGIEWKRSKWSLPLRLYFYFNELAGCYLANHLIADHPMIKQHLMRWVSESKITMIPYGADEIKQADEKLLSQYDLKPYGYALVIARPEPENSIYEIVKAFSEKTRHFKLVILGDFKPKENTYHEKIAKSASHEVVFLGAIYDKVILSALRFYTTIYVHGHTVGGTNPSLVEALGAGSPILAHDNPFNRWVAGEQQLYFSDIEECALAFDKLLDPKNSKEKLHLMSKASRERFNEEFTWEKILIQYETLFFHFLTNDKI